MHGHAHPPIPISTYLLHIDERTCAYHTLQHCRRPTRQDRCCDTFNRSSLPKAPSMGSPGSVQQSTLVVCKGRSCNPSRLMQLIAVTAVMCQTPLFLMRVPDAPFLDARRCLVGCSEILVLGVGRRTPAPRWSGLCACTGGSGSRPGGVWGSGFLGSTKGISAGRGRWQRLPVRV